MWPRPGTVGSRDRGGRHGVSRGGREGVPRRAAARHRRGGVPERLRDFFARPERHSVPPRPHGWLCRRSVCRAPAGCPGCWSVGQGRNARPVGGPEACGAGARPGGRASGRERRPPAGGSRPGARRHSLARRSGHFSPGRPGGPSERGHAPGHKGGPRRHSGPRASPRGTAIRRRRRAPLETGQWPAKRSPASLSCGGAARWRRAGARCRRTSSGRGGRCHRMAAAVWCQIA